MRWTSAVLGGLGLAIAVASGEAEERADTASGDSLVGAWTVGERVEGCNDVGERSHGETWVFEADGRFRRVSGPERKVEESGRWRLQFDGHELDLQLPPSTRGAPARNETHFIIAVDGQRLDLLTPTQVQQGVVVAQEKFTAFYHS